MDSVELNRQSSNCSIKLATLRNNNNNDNNNKKQKKQSFSFGFVVFLLLYYSTSIEITLVLVSFIFGIVLLAFWILFCLFFASFDLFFFMLLLVTGFCRVWRRGRRVGERFDELGTNERESDQNGLLFIYEMLKEKKRKINKTRTKKQRYLHADRASAERRRLGVRRLAHHVEYLLHLVRLELLVRFDGRLDAVRATKHNQHMT